MGGFAQHSIYAASPCLSQKADLLECISMVTISLDNTVRYKIRPKVLLKYDFGYASIDTAIE